MKTLSKMMVIVAICCVSTSAWAVPTIGVYFDVDASENMGEIHPGTMFNAYVIISDINDTVNAVEYKLHLPAGVAIIESAFGTEGALDFGSSTDGVLMGLGECVTVYNQLPDQDTFIVETLTCMSFQEFETVEVELTKYMGTEAEGQTNPRYCNCDAVISDMTPINGYLTSAVPTVDSSWGAVKALYSE